MRVLVTNPPWHQNGRKGIRAGCRIPVLLNPGQTSFLPFPFILAYTTSQLERVDGLEVRILDAIGEDLDEATYLDRVEAFAPELVIAEMSTASYYIDLELARRLKARTGARIAMSGPHVTALPAETMGECAAIDYVMLGEIEQTAVELAERLRDGVAVGGMLGLGWRDGDEVVVEPRRPLLRDLDTLAWPHRATLPNDRYLVPGVPQPAIVTFASRGCPYRCNYCLWPQTIYEPGSYRTRDPAAVVEEIVETDKRFGPFQSICFDDDTFNIGKARVMAIADELERRKVRLPFSAQCRADRFDDEETIRRLAKAGLRLIRIGVESGDAEVLRRAKRNFELGSVERTVRWARRQGVLVHMYVNIGLPGESTETVDKTIEFVRATAPDSVSFTTTTPYPGTTYYDEVVERGYLEAKSWEDFNVVHTACIRTEHLTAEELTREEQRAMRAVYRSPRLMMRRLQVASSPRELLALAKKGARVLARGRY